VASNPCSFNQVIFSITYSLHISTLLQSSGSLHQNFFKIRSVMNVCGSRICVLCFVIVDIFWLICCKWVWIILKGSVRLLVSLCSHGGVCEVLSAFCIELRRGNFSPGLQHVEAGEGCC